MRCEQCGEAASLAVHPAPRGAKMLSARARAEFVDDLRQDREEATKRDCFGQRSSTVIDAHNRRVRYFSSPQITSVTGRDYVEVGAVVLTEEEIKELRIPY